MPEPAAFAWLIIIVTLFGFEGWAVATHHHTMSEWIRMWSRQLPWLRPLGVVSLITLIWHLFYVS